MCFNCVKIWVGPNCRRPGKITTAMSDDQPMRFWGNLGECRTPNRCQYGDYFLLGEPQKCQNPEQVDMQPSGNTAAQLQSPVWGLFWQIGSALQKSVTHAAKYFDENGMSEDDFESFLVIYLESSRVPPSEAAGSHHRLFNYPYQRHNSCETASGLLQSGSMYWGSACFPKHFQWQLERACFHPVNAV